MTQAYSLDWAHAAEPPVHRAQLRQSPQDFQVDEELGFEPDGEGEHVYLRIRKRGENTAWVARQLAELAEVELHDVGYAGLKDRHAVTRQWFSVRQPGTGRVPWNLLDSDSLTVEAVTRHPRKLRRGAHQANLFRLTLRCLEGGDPALLEARAEQVSRCGVPNYFGPQRFGRGGHNLLEAERLLLGRARIRNRQKRGLILSAARSWLFNQVLDHRVRAGNWSSCIAGEIAVERLPSGPLWGRGRLPVAADCQALELLALAPWTQWCDALEHVGLQQERRALVCRPEGLSVRINEPDIELTFKLGSGEFATTVLRELCNTSEPLRGADDVV